jgi:hypothetical protein
MSTDTTKKTLAFEELEKIANEQGFPKFVAKTDEFSNFYKW